VVDADAFHAFKEKGLFDQETAAKFRKYILSAGGTDDPTVLYKKFRGLEPEIGPLLERRGLTSTGS
jgi:peptidyl-dipeptidase Dcp